MPWADSSPALGLLEKRLQKSVNFYSGMLTAKSKTLPSSGFVDELPFFVKDFFKEFPEMEKY